jgi:osmotically-inducible protein OsmY
MVSGIVIALSIAAMGCKDASADNKGYNDKETKSSAGKSVNKSMDKSSKISDDKSSQNISNARLETQIWTTYALSPYLRAHELKVSVEDGKATLTGNVDEDVNKDLAKQIALGVNGIKSVDNQIQVKSDYVAPKSTSGRSYGDKIDDATTTAAIKSKLLWSQSAEGFATHVETNAGKVTLKGNVDTASSKEHAGRLAKNTNGVVSVNNQLVVDGKKPAQADKAKTGNASDKSTAGIADGWITTKVKSTFMYSSNVNGSDISVSTKSGIDSLSGKVDSGAERALAIELAQNIRGVKSVNSTALSIDEPRNARSADTRSPR